MQLHMLTDELWFPQAEHSLPDGLLAIGGDLSKERLLLAYKNGIFPWFDDDVPMWWCPDPRFALVPERLKVSKSMKQVIRREVFEFRMNTSFSDVIRHCKTIGRLGQDGTWITDEVEEAYINLNKEDIVVSAEAWINGELVGGLYGIRLGNIFFGESMFSLVTNASKFAFISFVEQLKKEGVVLIDCQVYTKHLESLGAEMVPRTDFLSILKENIT